MPRVARRDAPGSIHHVLLRGIERRVVFRDDHDRDDFLRRLALILVSCGITCFGFALMPNHVHLILRTGSIPLSRAMARLGTGYAGGFNRRHDRPGHLFQNRYKALLVESDEYLRTLVRYVHLNPVRAGLVVSARALELHPWTGHAALVGRLDVPFLAVAEVLALFGESEQPARDALRAWMSLEEGPSHDGAVIEPSAALSQLIEGVAREFGVAAREIGLGVKRREVARARAIAAHVACDHLGIAQARVAARLGVGETAMTRTRARGQLLLPQGPPGLAQVLARCVPPRKE